MEINPQEQRMEHDVTTPINPNGRPIKWPIIIISIIFIITGQSLARLLETFYNHHYTNHSLHDGFWTQPLLQVIGFPLLILPFFFLLSSKKQSQLLITSHPTSMLLLYICTGVIMVIQVKLYTKGKLETTPYAKFLLFDNTQLYFTIILARVTNMYKIKFKLWFFISLVFTITIITTTVSSNINGEWSTLLAAFAFSFLLSNISFISTHNNNKEPIFRDVLELLIFSSLFATSVFISFKNHDLKRDMYGFSKGKIVYVMTMFGQAIAWQIYWLGVIGLVIFTESIVTTNMVSLATYPIVTSLKILLCNYEEDEFDVYLGGALVLDTIVVMSCFHKHIKVLRGFRKWNPSRFLAILFLGVVYYLYLSELLSSDHNYISPPSGFELF